MSETAGSSEIPTQTRTKLLIAAEALIVREGVVSLSVRRIAREAGVNSALIRYHFGDTAKLLLELARLNAGQIRDARNQLLDAAETLDFDAAVDALILPLFAPAAMSPDHRAIVVLDELYARAGTGLQEEIWAEFASGVRRVSDALREALGCTDRAGLAWRIRFVTAAALDIPPRSPRFQEHPRSPIYGLDSADERLLQFRKFARQALLQI